MSPPARSEQPVWRRCLASASIEASSYHAHRPRDELIDALPRPPRRLLEIGCGAGLTGRYVKERFSDAWVMGIDINEAAVAQAAGILDSALCASIESLDFQSAGLSPGSIDTIVMGDVLEHLYDPWRVMERLLPLLSPDGILSASIPNTRNLIVLNELAGGDWLYEEQGLLDITHIRFFTLKGIHRLLAETGWRALGMQARLDHRLTEIHDNAVRSALKRLRLPNVTISAKDDADITELCTFQYLVLATPA